ncbi:KAP family P-loop NTPase fold protein [Flavobacterium sp.]|uniref:KAP family P-loop NTPase fold protein n=1 Tax=Flavobacterium sp. TaxID=239 RepID=UPI0040485CB4
MDKKVHFLGDNAIKSDDDDKFNFKHYAGKVQGIIQKNADNVEPLVIGIYGKWGDGKTSFLNLLENKIDLFEKEKEGNGLLKYHFNPWQYNNVDEVLFDFFGGLSQKMCLRNDEKWKKVGERISKYSRYLKSVKISASVGVTKNFGTKVTFEPSEILKVLGEDLKGEELTLEALKEKVNIALEAVQYKVIVFIDDIDRLDKNEIYTILKLIKLNANFHKFIFIVTLDAEHVAKAINNRYGDNIEDGYLFLEKIINIPIHLPKIEKEDLQSFFENNLYQISNYLDLNERNKLEIQNISYTFETDLFNSPREIKRILNNFFISAFGFESEINLTDLFWIEYLKNKNERLYDKIKKYNRHKSSNSLFNGQSVLIDFNDDVTVVQEAKTMFKIDSCGTRVNLLAKHYDFEWIINKLFPIIANKDKDNSFNENLRINSANHFDKYFSYHLENKIKNATVDKLKFTIKNSDFDQFSIELEKLFENDVLNYKSIFTLDSLVKSYRNDLSSKVERDFLFLSIVKNIVLIPEGIEDMFGINNRIRFIELIAVIFNDTNVQDSNELICLKIAESLDVFQLCHFVRKFRIEQAPFKNELEEIIVQKAENYFNVDNPLFINPKTSVKMIMHYWKKYDTLNFEKHIETSLINIDRIKKLVRNFPGFWKDSKHGGLTKENYKYMKELINVDLVFSQIKMFDHSLIRNFNVDKYPHIDESNEYSEDENLEQFIYWYTKENKHEQL